RLVRDVPLPLADGVPVADGDAPAPGRSARLASSRVTEAADRVRELLAVLDGWPSSASAETHHAQTQRLFDALGWTTNGAAAEVADALASLAAEFPKGMELDADEWRTALIERLETVGEQPVGGAGGGVQLLTVTEARARTFDHLIVCGLVRGVFPRQVTDDAMLPDLVRGRLATDVLPEMPVKARSADEERYLYAQLVSSAPDVRLSWHLRENGSKMAPSPFAERLRRTGGSVDVSTVPGLWSPDAEPDGARPAYEHAVRLASAVSSADLDDLLALAVHEGRGAGSTASIPPERVAAARLAVVRAVERRPSATDAGPWSGFLGDVGLGDRVWVTVLERTAICPLQAHLERGLGIRPLPDPHLGIPDPDQRLLGSVVHDVLERIVTGGRDAVRVAFDEALAHAPISVPWPSSDRLEMLLDDAARRVVFDEGLGGFGLVPLLVARARPVLDVAAEIEWRGGTNLDDVLAAEIEGEVGPVAGGPAVAFRADRLDVGPVATDYKTGRPVSTVKTPTVRSDHLMREVRRGRKLQAAAYAMAAPAGVGRGRYVSLKPDIGDAPPDCRVAEAASDDPELSAAFANAVVTISSARSTGVAFPRVVEPEGRPADHCRYCPVAEACRRNDSAFVDQLVELMEGGDERADGPFGAARRLWWLGVDRDEETP
ncbi:MAG: PD-(D/E)XK nuclease family protein, partial [Holophagae bacterium]